MICLQVKFSERVVKALSAYAHEVKNNELHVMRIFPNIPQYQ